MRTKILLTTLAAAALLAGQASAALVLSDNFDSSGPPVLNWAGDGVFLSTGAPGSVDLIGSPPPFFDLQPGHGYYVDLDGSTGNGNDPAGQLTSLLTFGPGKYTLRFELAGNLRVPTEQSTTITLGGFSQTLTPDPASGFAPYAFTFTTASAGKLIFTESGPSNQQGNLLDNVTLNSVPEPATWAMMLLGFGGVGATLRSRRKQAAIATA